MASGKHFDDLPNEILLKIFSYLSIEDLAFSVQEVNSHWKAVAQDNKLWRGRVFCPRKNLTDKQIVLQLKKMPTLRSYCASRKTSSFVIQALCKLCKNIRSIDLHRYQSVDPLLLESIFNAFPNIESLKLQLPSRSVPELNRCMELISQCQKLTVLTFKWNDKNTFLSMHEGVLAQLVHGCPALQHLNIENVELLDENILELLEVKKNQLLSFSCVIAVTREFSERLGECTKLQYLDIININAHLLYSDIEPLMKLKNLKHFALRFCSELVMDNLPLFFVTGSFSKIVHLDLSECYFMNDVVVNTICRNCPLIRYFCISGSQSLHNEGLKYIGCCEQLEYLDVSMSMDLTDGSMEYVGEGCSNLKHLIITGCYKMTDKVIEHIVKCRQLKVLKFNYNDLTGSNFHLISSHLHNLVELHVESCKYLNKTFIENLHEKMPHLKIGVARRCNTYLDSEDSVIFY
ncbi:hypothetical protein L9F63_020281 [Diploptera punctata]|uniref:F-box domain-containing protein n=1 Tax=Diploptera punctata TaxID=6984 RepID=A0AAD7ZSL3_DIPPU|nr:hypothetical protein L9F63_020281 [Diploptera punctata]